jgi:hypothetical protein
LLSGAFRVAKASGDSKMSRANCIGLSPLGAAVSAFARLLV